MTPVYDSDADAIEARKNGPKPRSKGTLPHLPDTEDPEILREWLSLAFRPRPDWRVHDFHRQGRQKTDPCSIVFRNGRDQHAYRFNRQGDLWGGQLRSVVIAAGDGNLRMPHLTGSEVEDVWAALCQLGQVLTEYDECDETRKWIEMLLDDSVALEGWTLVPDARHDGLMAMKNHGQFTRADALALVRSDIQQRQLMRRPVRFIDVQTGEQWVRAGEAATHLRYVQGVEPLPHTTLRARLNEIGVSPKHFEDYRPPHPKLTLYQLTESLIEYVKEAPK